MFFIHGNLKILKAMYKRKRQKSQVKKHKCHRKRKSFIMRLPLCSRNISVYKGKTININ